MHRRLHRRASVSFYHFFSAKADFFVTAAQRSGCVDVGGCRKKGQLNHAGFILECKRAAEQRGIISNRGKKNQLASNLR
jgi:hypothetical protein